MNDLHERIDDDLYPRGPLYGARADWSRIDGPSRATTPPPVHPQGLVTVGRHRAPWPAHRAADGIAAWMQAQS